MFSILYLNGTAHVCYDDFRHEKAFFLVSYDDDIPACCAGGRTMDDTTGDARRVYARRAYFLSLAGFFRIKEHSVPVGQSVQTADDLRENIMGLAEQIRLAAKLGL